MERSRDLDFFKPSKRELIDRVVSSAALKMTDHHLIALPRSLSNEGTPIIINNACVSWHELAGNFIFGGARAYVGTLFPISTTEAEEVVTRALTKYYGKHFRTLSGRRNVMPIAKECAVHTSCQVSIRSTFAARLATSRTSS